MSASSLQFSEGRVLGIHIGLALSVLVLDQISKSLILAKFEHLSSVRITEFFNILLVYNKGAAFGFLADSDLDANKLFLFANIGILFLLFYVLWKFRPGRSQSVTGIWLIIGGAFGNITDRIVYGHVVDFLDLHYGNLHYSTFNLADTCISVGAVLIAMEIFNIKLFFRHS